MAPPNSMILDLPTELLLQLPAYLHNIEDFKNASSTCTRLRNIFADTLPKTILRLAADSAPTFFSPHPHFLVLAVARQVATWAVAVEAERRSRIKRLVDAIRGGMHGILTLALRNDVEGVGLRMEEIRELYEARFSIINPLDRTIDAMIGHAWYAQPDFWDGGAEDAFTLYADVSSATFQFLIYGELFGPTMHSFLQLSAHRKPGLDIDARIEFIKYCIPDWISTPQKAAQREDGFEVLPLGPYAEQADISSGTDELSGNQTALAHLVGGAMFGGMLWKRVWRRVLIAAGAEANKDGRWPQAWIDKLQQIEFRNPLEHLNDEEESSDVEADNDEGEDGKVSVEARATESDVYGAADGVQHDELPEDWRFALFWKALTQTSGLQTMGMVAQFQGRGENQGAIMKPEWKAHILRLRDQALALEDGDEPGLKQFGRSKLNISEAPDLGSELYWCCSGMWGGL